MLGCQRLFQVPASCTSSARLSYDQACGTPGKVQVWCRVAVAVLPVVSTPVTETAGARGPMPATTACSWVLTSAPLAPANATGVTSFFASPAARAAAAAAAPLVSGSGLGPV